MGCIYACGGRKGIGTHPSGSTVMLDPRTRAWATLPAMPTPVAAAQAAVVAGRMCVPGGYTLQSMQMEEEEDDAPIVQCYNLVAGRWDTSCAHMELDRSFHAVAALHGEVWAVGGRDLDGFALFPVEVYNPRLNTWRSGVSLPHSWSGGACVVVQ